MKGLFVILLLCMLTGMSSCMMQYGNNLDLKSVPINSEYSSPINGNVFIFYDVEKIDFDYSKRCLVEVVSNQYTSEEELMNRLKYQAHLNGANAIIGLKSYYINRETGFYKDPKSNYSYLAKVYSGIAVKINSDSLYKSSKFGDWKNTDYLTKNESYVKRDEDELALKIIFSTIGLIIGIVYAATKT